jgi:flagellar hook-length control protein FliK
MSAIAPIPVETASGPSTGPQSTSPTKGGCLFELLLNTLVVNVQEGQPGLNVTGSQGLLGSSPALEGVSSEGLCPDECADSPEIDAEETSPEETKDADNTDTGITAADVTDAIVMDTGIPDAGVKDGEIKGTDGNDAPMMKENSGGESAMGSPQRTAEIVNAYIVLKNAGVVNVNPVEPAAPGDAPQGNKGKVQVTSGGEPVSMDGDNESHALHIKASTVSSPAPEAVKEAADDEAPRPERPQAADKAESSRTLKTEADRFRHLPAPGVKAVLRPENLAEAGSSGRGEHEKDFSLLTTDGSKVDVQSRASGAEKAPLHLHNAPDAENHGPKAGMPLKTSGETKPAEALAHIEKPLPPKPHSGETQIQPVGDSDAGDVLHGIHSDKGPVSRTVGHTAEPVRTVEIDSNTYVITRRSATHIEVSLKPEGLGKLDIEVNFDKGVVNAHISASDPEGKGMIERNIHAILHALDKEGLQIGGFTVAMRDERRDMKDYIKGQSQETYEPQAVRETRPARVSERGMISIFA